MDSVPTSLDTLTREIMRLQIEREAIKKEKDELSKRRVESIDETLGNLQAQEKELRTAWDKEKAINDAINNDAIDVTLPGRRISVGSTHPLTKIINELEDLFFQLW